MANIRSAKKRILVNKTKAMQNKIIKTQLKSAIRKFDAAVLAGNKDVASEAYRLAVKKVDQAAARGVIHKNAAARKKSQLTLKFNQIA